MSHDTRNALTFADLLQQIGQVDPQRIRLRPPPGQATEKDILRLYQREHRRYELVDGVLVEKVMGFQEAFLATWLGYLLQDFLVRKDLGVLAGSDGALRLMPRLVRIPDLSFVRWKKLPGRQLPEEPIPDLAPDLAVEVLSKSNTPSEMARKLRDYFQCGVRLVWFLDPKKHTAEVYTAPNVKVALTEADSLDGGDVLPGLTLPLRQVFERLPKAAAPGPSKRKKAKKKRPPPN